MVNSVTPAISDNGFSVDTEGILYIGGTKVLLAKNDTIPDLVNLSTDIATVGALNSFLKKIWDSDNMCKFQADNGTSINFSRSRPYTEDSNLGEEGIGAIIESLANPTIQQDGENVELFQLLQDFEDLDIVKYLEGVSGVQEEQELLDEDSIADYVTFDDTPAIKIGLSKPKYVGSPIQWDDDSAISNVKFDNGDVQYGDTIINQVPIEKKLSKGDYVLLTIYGRRYSMNPIIFDGESVQAFGDVAYWIDESLDLNNSNKFYETLFIKIFDSIVFSKNFLIDISLSRLIVYPKAVDQFREYLIESAKLVTVE